MGKSKSKAQENRENTKAAGGPKQPPKQPTTHAAPVPIQLANHSWFAGKVSAERIAAIGRCGWWWGAMATRSTRAAPSC